MGPLGWFVTVLLDYSHSAHQASFPLNVGTMELPVYLFALHYNKELERVVG